MKNQPNYNRNKIAYFVLTLLFTFLIYKQKIGLNMFIISLLSVAYLSTISDTPKNKRWWISALLFVGSALSLFLSHTFLGGFLFFLTGFNFISVNYNSNYSFPFSISHTFFSFILGFARFLTPNKKAIEIPINENLKKENKILKSIFLYATPIVIVIIFLKLYQLANPKFEEYTQFLSLEFIEWPFIFMYIMISFVFYGFYLYNTYKPSEDWDFNTKNSIDTNYTDSFQNKIGIDTEQKMASILLITLNILLIAFLSIDGITLFSTNIDAELSHSQTVHQGINVLITSIVLVILIVGFMYRGSLNFIKNRPNLYLTFSWLILNIIMTIFNSMKNYNYINEWGLTHKRIGVFIYLTLCIIGLSFTLYKVLNAKSFTFLIRRVSYSFVSFLVFYSIINWNYIIISYNLNDTHFNESTVDLYYNYNLGYSTYPELVSYFKKHPNVNTQLLNQLNNRLIYIKENVKTDWKDLPSIKWFDYRAKQKLKDYKPVINSDQNQRTTWEH